MIDTVDAKAKIPVIELIHSLDKKALIERSLNRVEEIITAGHAQHIWDPKTGLILVGQRSANGTGYILNPGFEPVTISDTKILGLSLKNTRTHKLDQVKDYPIVEWVDVINTIIQEYGTIRGELLQSTSRSGVSGKIGDFLSKHIQGGYQKALAYHPLHIEWRKLWYNDPKGVAHREILFGYEIGKDGVDKFTAKDVIQGFKDYGDNEI